MKKNVGKGRSKSNIKKNKLVNRADNSSKTKQIIEVISWIVFGVLLLSFLSGVALYEMLLLLLFAFFARIVTLVRDEKKTLSINQKLTLLLTLIIAFFTIMQVWTAFYEKIPRVYGPNMECQEYLQLLPDGSGTFSFSVGNYGELPAWLFVDFQNTTQSLSIVGKNKYTVVLVPIIYSDNKQSTQTFQFKVNNTKQSAGFTFKNWAYGDDIIDRGAALYKMILNALNIPIFNKLTCNYERINSTTYVLKS